MYNSLVRAYKKKGTSFMFFGGQKQKGKQNFDENVLGERGNKRLNKIF